MLSEDNQISIFYTYHNNLAKFEMYSINNMLNNEYSIFSNPNPRIRKKSPGTAFAFSLIYPGIGQFYNGDAAKGFIHLIFHTISTPLAIIFIAHNEPEQDFLKVGFLSIAGINYLWSLIDAPITANRINKERAKLQSHLLQFDIHHAVVGIDMGVKEKTLATNLAIHF